MRESNGLVGLNFAVTMLRADGRENADTPISDMIRHIDYLVERLGIDGVALGSDFDGATDPGGNRRRGGLQKLVAGLKSAGYGDGDLAKICRENWLRVLALRLARAAGDLKPKQELVNKNREHKHDDGKDQRTLPR